MTAKLPEVQWLQQKVPHEILWLVGILGASVPLAWAVWHFRGASPLLTEAWQQVLPVPLHQQGLLYLAIAAGCYLGRLVAKALTKLGPAV
ncbi:hypothetical protein [Hymenobacter bucti]|uniref:Uncharacterized protein n=1 Tax=Hymenobacter bucti TaxID=1844114 RepID=A0ABW4QSV6_9BACT